MKCIPSLTLVLVILFSAAALAEQSWLVMATADVNLRSGPGLSYDTVGAVSAGNPVGILYDWSDVSTDSRGVKWYNISVDCWVSSKYTYLLDCIIWTDLIDAYTDLRYDPVKARDYQELSVWYDEPIIEAAEALGMEGRAYTYGEAPLICYHGGASIAGWTDYVFGYYLTGQGYTLYGVCPGMDVATAAALLAQEPTLVNMEWKDGYISLEHKRNRAYTSTIDYMENDFAMYVNFNDDNIVTSIEVYSYTG